MKKNKGKFSFTLLQAIGTVFKSFILVGLLGGIAAMMIGSFILIKTIETAPELDVSKIYATESFMIRTEILSMSSESKSVNGFPTKISLLC